MGVSLRIILPLLAGILLVGLPITGESQRFYFDDFPVALPNYVTGGWQGPFGDGTGGTIGPTGDQMGVLLDGTVNALSYAIRRSVEVTDVNLTVDFAIQNRDMTVADQFSLLLAWKSSTYPGQSSCPPCSGPTPQSGVVVNFNIGRASVRVTEITNSVGTEVAQAPSALSAGGANEARVEYSQGTLSIYLNGVRELLVAGLQKPAGTLGFMTYRMDVAVDSLRFELPETAPGAGNPSASLPSPWILGLVAGVAGGGVVGLSFAIMSWAKNRKVRK